MLGRFKGGGGDKKAEKKSVLGKKLKSINFKRSNKMEDKK